MQKTRLPCISIGRNEAGQYFNHFTPQLIHPLANAECRRDEKLPSVVRITLGCAWGEVDPCTECIFAPSYRISKLCNQACRPAAVQKCIADWV
jgi:hypothetical protein